MSEFPDPLPVAANLPAGYLSHDLAGTGKVSLPIALLFYSQNVQNFTC